MLIFHLKKSYVRLLFSVAVHVAALVIVCVVHWWFSLQCLLVGVLFFSGYLSCAEALHCFSKSIKSLVHYDKQVWLIQSRERGFVAVKILPQSVLSRYFLLLHLMPLTQAQKKRITLFIDVGTLPANARRQVRALVARYI